MFRFRFGPYLDLVVGRSSVDRVVWCGNDGVYRVVVCFYSMDAAEIGGNVPDFDGLVP